MDDLRRELAALRGRIRLQMFAFVGLLSTMLFAMGGADVVARGLVEADAWRVRTRKVDTSLADRMVVTTDVDQATVRITKSNLVLDSTAGSQANLKLAEQSSAPATAPGTLWYDSTSSTDGKLKYYNGSAWVEPSAGGFLAYAQFTGGNVTLGNGSGTQDFADGAGYVEVTFSLGASTDVLIELAGASITTVWYGGHSAWYDLKVDNVNQNLMLAHTYHWTLNNNVTVAHPMSARHKLTLGSGNHTIRVRVGANVPGSPGTTTFYKETAIPMTISARKI